MSTPSTDNSVFDKLKLDPKASQIQLALFNFTKMISENKLLLILAIVFFVALAFGFYQLVVKPMLSPVNPPEASENREFVPPSVDSAETRATLYYFYTTWCPICKNSSDEVDKFITAIGASPDKDSEGIVNGVRIMVEKIDCDQNSDMADEFGITGYPTIKLVYLDKVYEYDAKPSSDVLMKFVSTTVKSPGNNSLDMASIQD